MSKKVVKPGLRSGVWFVSAVAFPERAEVL